MCHLAQRWNKLPSKEDTVHSVTLKVTGNAEQEHVLQAKLICSCADTFCCWDGTKVWDRPLCWRDKQPQQWSILKLMDTTGHKIWQLSEKREVGYLPLRKASPNMPSSNSTSTVRNDLNHRIFQLYLMTAYYKSLVRAAYSSKKI